MAVVKFDNYNGPRWTYLGLLQRQLTNVNVHTVMKWTKDLLSNVSVYETIYNRYSWYTIGIHGTTIKNK